MKLKHLLIIPDGNRRWAKNKKLETSKGHEFGAKTTQELFRHVVRNHSYIKYCSFWAMSRDNFIKRPKKEIKSLINLIRIEIQEFTNDLLIHEKKVNVRFYGSYEKLFDKKTIDDLKKVEKRTEKYSDFYVSILLAYNGKDELIEGLKKIKDTHNLTENKIKQVLWTRNLPPVDLIIRTGTENDPHLSGNILLWQTDYSQLYFSNILYPDFTVHELDIAINDYNNRLRRKGK